MVVVFPFNDPHPPTSRSPTEPSYTKSSSKLEVFLPGISRSGIKVEVNRNKVHVTGQKSGHVVYKLIVKLSGAENGVDIRKETGSVTVKLQRRRG